MGEILITVIFAVAIPVIFIPLYFRFCAHDKQKTVVGPVINVKRGALICELCFAVILYAAAVIIGIICTILAPAVATYVCVALLGTLSALFSYGYINDNFKYIIIEENGIRSVRIYSKDKFFPYDKIKYYRLFSLFACPCIILYDKVGIHLFLSECDDNTYVLTNKFNERGIVPVPNGEKFPTREMRKTEEYKTAIKASNRKAPIILFTVCWVCFIALFGMVMGINSPPPKFINYEVSGVVESFDYRNTISGSSNFTLTLQDDDHTYCIYSTVYREVDDDLRYDLQQGDTVKLLIAYDDDNKRYVSQLELNGYTYLKAADAEAADAASYKSGRTMSYVFLGLGIGSFILDAVFVIIYIVRKKREQKQAQENK